MRFSALSAGLSRATTPKIEGMPTKKARKPRLDAPTLAAMHLNELAKAKAAYAIADAALVSLRKKINPGAVITLPAAKWIAEHLRELKYELEDRGDSFSVGQTARRFRLKRSKRL